MADSSGHARVNAHPHTAPQSRKKLLCVVGARPNFMKIAPIARALKARAPGIDMCLVHTGQHYDVAMNQQFFEQLAIPAPDVSLEVGSGSHAQQTAEIMKRFEPVLDREQPDAILVVGDVNSTIACALVAAKKGIRVIHVEAGLRSRDRTMPEEINRILTDQLSDRLYVTEAEAIENLVQEGIDRDKIVFAGNVMIDTLLASLSNAIPSRQTLACGESKSAISDWSNGFAVLTLHRPSNVDEPRVLQSLLATVAAVSQQLPVVFPVHPRTRHRLTEAGLDGVIAAARILLLPPLGYLEMLGLLRDARLILTDSGGLQEEATALGVACLTLRDNTERPITINQGTNVLVGTDPGFILSAVARALATPPTATAPRPEKWDGRSASRIVDDLVDWLGARILESTCQEDIAP